MRRILEDLYHGGLSANEKEIRSGSKYKRALSEVVRLEEALYPQLPEAAHDMLREYALASTRLSSVSMVEDFIAGFRMGAQIMMAILLPDEEAPEIIGNRSEDE